MAQENERAMDEELYRTSYYIMELTDSNYAESWAVNIARWHLKQLAAAKREARNRWYKAALLQMKRWAQIHNVKGREDIEDYTDHIVTSLTQCPDQQLPELEEFDLENPDDWTTSPAQPRGKAGK